MKSKKTPKKFSRQPKPTLVEKKWQNIKQSLAYYRFNWKKLFLLAVVVMLPTSIIRSYSSAQYNSSLDLSLVMVIASLYCLIALFWFVQKRTSSAKISEVYVESSTRFFPLLLIFLVLSLLFLPTAAGLILMLLTFLAGLGTIYSILGAVLFFASIYITIRLIFSLVIGIEPKTTWRLSIIKSWQITKKRGFYIIFSLLIYLVCTGLIVGLITTLFSYIPAVGTNSIANGVLNGLLISFALPLLVVYWNGIYNNLSQTYEQSLSQKKS